MESKNLVLCLKISQPKWIEKLQSGEAWFGAINNYITEAEKTNNNEQGDRFEGIFAHLPKNALSVHECKVRFGDDLEIIDDGDFCFLRRKSARFHYAFCMYGVKNTELKLIDEPKNIGGVLKGHFRYEIAPQMYNSFLQDGSTASEVAGYYCSPGHIVENIEQKLNESQYNWARKMIEYDIEIEKEFFIEPSSDYPELWHKRKDLDYQHEMRFLIYNFGTNCSGIAVQFEPLSTDSGNSSTGELYIEGTAILGR